MRNRLACRLDEIWLFESGGIELLLRGGVLVWAVATTQPNGEAGASERLGRFPIECYNPRTRDFGTGRVSSLFPGYLFVRPSVDVAWQRLVAGTRGINSVMMSCGHPALVGDGELNHIIQGEVEAGLVLLPDPIQKNSLVTVDRGPLFGCSGLVTGVDGRRVWALLQLLGQKVRVQLSRADVVLA